MADFLASSWLVILICVAVGYVLGRCRPISGWRVRRRQLDLGLVLKKPRRWPPVRPPQPWPRR